MDAEKFIVSAPEWSIPQSIEYCRDRAFAPATEIIQNRTRSCPHLVVTCNHGSHEYPAHLHGLLITPEEPEKCIALHCFQRPNLFGGVPLIA